MPQTRSAETQKLTEAIMETYQPETTADVSNALKDLMGSMIEKLLQEEMNNHLGYQSNDKNYKLTNNRRNGYANKTVKSSIGDISIDVPRDRESTFEPQIVKKHQSDISGIEDKVLSLYARGASQRDIAATINDIYGCDISHTTISNIIDKVMPEVEEWRNRPLKPCYPFVFVDCLYSTVRKDGIAKETAVYIVLGYDVEGKKDILGIWTSESESKNYWMQIFDELKARGVEDIFFISMDGVSGLEAGAKAIFPNVVVQRCIVHMIRNSIKYVPSKDYKAFTASLKKIYAAVNLRAATAAFETFCKNWEKYPGAVRVWESNFKFVEQLFDYGSDVRRIMYTTNAIESVNASFRKVTKKGAFPNENALFKALYLRTTELTRKWAVGHVRNWSSVLNQLMINDTFKGRLEKYIYQA